MIVCIGAKTGSIPRPRSVFWFVAGKAIDVLRLAGRIVVCLMLVSVPFLALSGGIFWWLLTEHDINYYLTERPPQALLAVALVGSTLALMAALLIRYIMGWVYATAILLLEDASPVAAMQLSRNRTRSHRKLIFVTLLVWGSLNLLLRTALSFGVVLVCQQLVFASSGRLTTLVLALGTMIFAVFLSNLFVNVVANITLASCLSMLYIDDRGASNVTMPPLSSQAYPRKRSAAWVSK